MNKQLQLYADKINALSTRERLLIALTFMVALGFLWWNFFAQPLQARTQSLHQQNQMLASQNQAQQQSIDVIQQRIRQGVYKTEQQKLDNLKAELKRVNDLLRQKTLELIEPDEMFELMQQLIFADSNLKLTGLNRKQVKPAFESEQSDSDQPEIYRHIMQMRFEGKYQDVLNYISRIEKLEWKLIWDKISLKTKEYPVISVEIEISTLSDDLHWVGL